MSEVCIGVSCGVIFVSILVLCIMIGVSLERLKSNEYGLKYNTLGKRLGSDAVGPGGRHIGPPGFEFVRFPSTFVTVDLPVDTCVSRDGLRVKYTVTFQYQLPEDNLLPVVLKYRDFEKWQKVVVAAGRSAIQHTCADFNISNFQNKRGIIQSMMEDNLRFKLEGRPENDEEGVYALAISLQLRNVELPVEYNEAVARKQAAAEEIALAKNQRTQERTKAETSLFSAMEEARKINDTAINDAEVIMTEARLAAEETLYAFEKEAEIIVGVKESLNLTNAGVLAYMANRLYAEVPSLHVSAAEPAKLSRKDAL